MDDEQCAEKSHSRMDLHSLFVLLIIFLLSFLFFLVHRWDEDRASKLPPGPNKLPIIGNLHQLMSDLPHRSLQRLSKIYGPIMFLRLGSKPTLVISSADMAQQIFKTHDAIFSSRPVMHAGKILSYNGSDIGFAPYGEYWREAKKLAVLELLSIKKVQSFRAVREEEVALMIASIGSSQGPIDLSETLLHLANDVLCRVAFGRKYDRDTGFQALCVGTEELLGGFVVADYFPWLRWIHKIDGLDTKLEKNFRKFNDFFDEIIEEHLNPMKTKAEVDDFLDVMLRVQRQDTLKVKLTNDNIKGILMDMFLAGTSPCSAALIWSMTALIKNPTIMKKVQEEVRAVAGNKPVVEESDLPRLNYLKLTFKEALRLHPPAPILVPRETTETCVVQGYQIPAKTRVYINAKSIMADPKVWENPEEFWPERFQDKSTSFNGQEYDLVPFGLGRRICPGIEFALSIDELALANLLHCFNWELPQGMKRESMDINEVFGMIMTKKVPLCLVASKSM